MITSLERQVLEQPTVLLQDLEYIAYSGDHDLAHGLFRGLSVGDRRSVQSRYIFQSVMLGGISKLRKFLSSSAEDEANEEKRFLDVTMRDFLGWSRKDELCPRELFETGLAWGEELTRLSLLQEALHTYSEMLDMGAHRYPDLYARIVCAKADVMMTMGRFGEAEPILRSLVDRPYVLTDRNVVASVLLLLGKSYAQRGKIAAYKSLLFRGLKVFYRSFDYRRRFFEQIKTAYRRSYRVLLDRRRTLGERILFLCHWICFRVELNRVGRFFHIDRLLRQLLLGMLYYVNFIRGGNATAMIPASDQSMIASSLEKRRNGNSRRRNGVTQKGRNVLVTRAMGGIGDLFMMTPGLGELKKKHSDGEIHLAIPQRYFSLFHGNTDVVLHDIDKSVIDTRSYSKWFNLTECPAARIESRSAPRVRKNRIEIFARALGLSRWKVRLMNRRPRYFVTSAEQELRAQFWRNHKLEGQTVIGIQLHAEETYRDYPHMPQLVDALARRYRVLVFEAQKVSQSFDPRVIPVDGLPVREAFAIASGCDLLICPDSAFVHLAAAVDIPCIALYGPIDGRVRTKDYPKCTYIDERGTLGCLPCWRNESIPCKLTGMRVSVCLAGIFTTTILKEVEQVLARRVPA